MSAREPSGPVLVNLAYLSPHMAGVLRHSVGILQGLLALEDGPAVEIVTTRNGLRAMEIFGLNLPSSMVTLVPADISRSKPLGALAALTLVPLIARRRRASTILNLDYYFSPGLGGTRSISMVTDVRYLEQPENFSRSGRWSRAIFLRLASRFADGIIAISRTSADEFTAVFPQANDKTHVVHLGIDEPAGVVSNADRTNELLFVGTTEAHKNLGVVIEAIEHGLVPDAAVLIAGGAGNYEAELQKAAANPAIADRIERLGRIDDDDLWELYRRSNILIAPSLYEGFDLPTIEAMSAGAHVVASDLPVHREILQDHAEYFGPDDPASLAAAIRSAQQRTHDQRIRAIAHARSYSWDRSAEVLTELL